MKTISIVNQKGGVGKTTTTMNLATALCAMKKKVLVVDLDPQSNTTSGLGMYETPKSKTTYEVLLGSVNIQDAILPTPIPNLSILPTNINLSGAEVELATLSEKEFRLKKAISQVSNFDYVFIDCPPSLGLLTVNALVASNEVLIPLQCEYFALEGLSHLVNTIKAINVSLNKSLDINGILLTMYDSRNNLSKLISTDVREYYCKLVYNTVIPRNVKVSEAPSHGYPVIIYEPNCVGAKAYIDLAAELIKREAK